MASSITLEIAGVRLGIESKEERMLGHMARYCHKFVTPKKGEWRLRLTRRRTLPKGLPDPRKLFWNAERFQFRTRFLWIDGNAKTKTIDVTATLKPGWGDILRTTAGLLMVRLGGILLHGAAILDDGRARVFFGPSGRGKTTVSRLAEAEGMRILTDESIAILPGMNGFQAWATPFYGELGHVSLNAGAPIEFVALLEHASQNKLIPLEKKKLFQHLVSNAFFSPGNVYAAENLFDNVEKLAKNIPGYILQFLPNRALWNFINDEIGLQTSAQS